MSDDSFEAPSEGDVQSALPLRMIVEWAYCPRLFHYMHVDGVMVANEHVLRGRHAHARADAPGTARVRRVVEDADAGRNARDDEAHAGDVEALPKEWREARAVDVASGELGVIARLDGVLLDGQGTAIPTELKSGHAPDAVSPYTHLAEGAWDADAIHVAIQALALEQAGYTVPRGELYYRASRTRVHLRLTDELRAASTRTIANARAAHRATERPAPLVDSPKCRGCSLAETCLPDESRLLREGVSPDDGLDETFDGGSDAEGEIPAGKAALPRGAALTRRLVASALETRTVTVSTPGASVRKEGEALVLVPPPDTSGKGAARPVRVAFDTMDALALVGQVNASTPALMACLERGIAVSFHQANGKLLGSVGSGLASNVALRAEQHAWAADPSRSLALAREFVRGKLRNQRVFLRRHGVLTDEAANEWESLLRGIDRATDGDALRGVEGRAARVYFEAFSGLVAERGGERFRMVGRTRRPPRDATNAMLSFGYAVLSRECAEVTRRVGFDPMRGFLHGMGWGRPALGLDLVEEFRVLIVDSTVLRVVAEKRVVPQDFHQELQGVSMTPAARRAFLQALDQRREEEITHPVFGYRVSYRRAIELQARVLARVLEGEAERYVALTTR